MHPSNTQQVRVYNSEFRDRQARLVGPAQEPGYFVVDIPAVGRRLIRADEFDVS